ncbi:hypothetical protein A3F00_02480 [Candidatus Daviesbacteria bacterium RIFCSPHIGHO2_12_FULL_37_11]|uniref:Uncharacterized protein n=1 Tax=Candidatus Daviesbacteria bacterium RIFCSPHIGHO2_12_FULL_37_11 TaxID=1797777 RepID=A0A1F5K8I7_9BACT|nr:MAG: hypothetical protein A2769_01330 [Candidatus Daviesbacteria bacterium RIFCSPHIGHO2_01_FULL_37_27]OGE37247.1 MAG: hypothetical protein A3F00_02480 [Candidatus Daviesbacteria bacterium RIFCSPHIGHO2_12_FULL_37_11]OGE46120.1 MAG: hypothetical protein A3B39_00935 [Candidatus Daviesbacteria bacterium RIFCSPLOWO2_01_FULL_37_10]
MRRSSEVLLSSTLHDPRGVFLETLPKVTVKVLENYAGWVINTTKSTNPNVKQQIKSYWNQGLFFSETDPKNTVASDPIENDHLFLLNKTLKLSKRLNLRKIQYTDGDRIIVAAKYYPRDFQDIATMATSIDKELSYLNFRRSGEDYLTHHPPLVQTELEFNRLYSEVFGINLDIGSTAHVFSTDVLEAVTSRSSQMEPVSFPHPKWLLIAKEMGARINSVETLNVLTFETPEQFREEAEQYVLDNFVARVIPTENGVFHFPLRKEDLTRKYSLLQQVYMRTLGLKSTISPKEWDNRFRTEQQYLELLRNHLHIFNFDRNQEDAFKKELEDVLISLANRRQIILKSLPSEPKLE